MIRRLPPLKRFGQNFLIDPNIVRKILSAARISRRDCVLEIGPGRGVLAFPMARRAHRVVAVEIDRGLCAALQEHKPFPGSLRLINRDILKFDIKRYARREKIRSFKVVANLPYYITTPVLEYLFVRHRLIADIFIMVQKEVAQRMRAAAGQGGYGSLTCFVNYFTKPELLFSIKRGSFWPAPSVDSAFLRLTPWPDPQRHWKVKSPKLCFKIIRAAFGQRRKQLRNALANVLPSGLSLPETQGQMLSRRAETLSLGDFVRLSNDVFDFLKER